MDASPMDSRWVMKLIGEKDGAKGSIFIGGRCGFSVGRRCGRHGRVQGLCTISQPIFSPTSPRAGLGSCGAANQRASLRGSMDFLWTASVSTYILTMITQACIQYATAKENNMLRKVDGQPRPCSKVQPR
jgi:hypothetical protein